MFVPFLAYEASAGSGKTFNLVVRYLSLLFKGVDPGKILALTFTNKAASEMSERIILTLKELPSKGELDEISKVTQLSKDEILDARKEVLDNFLSSDSKIMTIDKFFAQILRKFSQHVGIMPNFTTYDSQHKIKLLIRFLNELQVASLENTMVDLSLYFSKRVEDLNLYLDELYQKRFELLGLNYEKKEFLSLEKSVLDLAEQIKLMLQNSPNASATANSSFEVDSIDELLKKSFLERETLDYRVYSKCYTPELDRKFFELKDALKEYFQAKESNFFYSLFKLLDVYKSAKHMIAKNDAELSFDDVSSLCYYLLKERIDSEFIYFRLDSMIEHILLDEFQDTSLIQFEILKPLLDELRSGVGAAQNRSLFFVGDVKQSIYRFRGGRQELFFDVAKMYDVELKQLKVNYRSSKEVVEFVNRVFKNKIASYTPQEVIHEDGYVEVLTSDDVLETLHKRVEFLKNEGVDINDIAILCATNGDGIKISDYLENFDINVITETSTKLINQQHVMALCEYLKYCYYKEEIYARGFFALISREYEENLIIYDTRDLQKCVKSIIEHFKLFDGDLNILKFIEVLGSFKDIEEFIYEHERLSDSAIKSELRGIRVLTIHKSKGLEFEHVILLDRFSNPPASRDSIIYDYDGLKLKRLFLRFKARKFVDEEYAQALLRESELEYIDNINALYVALTRAKFSLQIIQKSQKSSFEILSLDSYKTAHFNYVKKPLHVEQQKDKIEYVARSYGLQDELLRVEEEHEEDFHAKDYGVALHYVLEMIKEFDGSYLDEALMCAKNRFSNRLSEDDFENIKKRLLVLFENSEFRDLSDGESFKEQPISYNGELRYIDLLVKKSEKYIVIDYKSSYAFGEQHKKQVTFYKEAISALTALHVEAFICYILNDEIKFVKI